MNFKELINILTNFNIDFTQQDNKIIIKWPYLINDKEQLKVCLEIIEDEIFLSDLKSMKKGCGFFSADLIKFLKDNNIFINEENYCYTKASLNKIYYDVQNFVSIMIYADLMQNGEKK